MYTFVTHTNNNLKYRSLICSKFCTCIYKMATYKNQKETVSGLPDAISTKSSPLRRKSLLTHNTNVSTLSENNDEAEKLTRRLAVDASLHLTEHKNAGSKRKSLGLGFLVHMTAPEINNRISECIKLNTENKISTKNAFSFQIIDLMTYMTKQQDVNMANLQIASTSLDVSTKIYGFRVDHVYTEIMKMAGGLDKEEGGSLGHSVKDHQCNDQENNIDNIQKKGKQKKKNKHKVFSTVEGLKGNIEVVKPSLWIMENEDTHTTDGLYQVMQLNNANSKFSLQLYSGVVLDTIENKTDNITKYVTIPEIKEFSDNEICPPLVNFQFHEWNDNETENNEKQFRFDLDASSLSDNENQPYQDDVNYLDILDEEEHTEEHVEQQQPVEQILDICKVISNAGANKSSEYSFFQRNTKMHWAGPSHWRVSNFSKLVSESKIIGACQQKRDKKRKEFELCYDDDKKKAVLELFTTGKYSVLDSAKIDWDEYSITLPRDVHYNITDAKKLYHHKLISINVETENLNNTHISDTVHDYEYSNENHTLNYCPNVPNDDYDADKQIDEDIYDTEGENVKTITEEIFSGDNLVSVPKLTNKVSIAYSTRAKRIDMQQLKKSIWKSLTSISENEITNNKNIEIQEKEKDKIVENTHFSQIYKALPNMLTKTNRESLSFPICFVSLLHLANEKILNIQSCPDMSDLIIKAD